MQEYYKDKFQKEDTKKEIQVDTNTKKAKQKKKRGLTSYFIVALCAAIIGGAIGGYIFPTYLYGNIIPLPEEDNSQIERAQGDVIINTEDDIYFAAAVYKKASDSVVGITTRETYIDFFGEEKPLSGIGSGVIVREDGYILTNSHVIADGASDSIEVLFSDGTTSQAKVLWYATFLDLAIIKVNKNNLKAIELGDSDELMIGEPVVAIGNPLSLDLDRTETSGIISGLDRTLRIDRSTEIKHLIQTDASINPGNSGGPLLNSKGQLIGINTAKLTSAEGLGFAIPINEAKPILAKIVTGENIEEVYIGIKGVDLETYEEVIGVDLDAEFGVVIVEIIKDSPAQKAELKPLDIIQEIDGEKIENMDNVIRKLYRYNSGDKLNIKVIREGSEKEIQLELKEKPSNY